MRSWNHIGVHTVGKHVRERVDAVQDDQTYRMRLAPPNPPSPTGMHQGIYEDEDEGGLSKHTSNVEGSHWLSCRSKGQLWRRETGSN